MAPPPLPILFVCLGNVCRSPTAAGLFQKQAASAGTAERYAVGSAGLLQMPGAVCPLETVEVAAAHGVDLRRHLSTPLSAELARSQALIIAMDRMNVEGILNLAPEMEPRVRLLMRFAGGDPVDVVDPIGRDFETFRRTFAQIEAGVTALTAALDGWDPATAPAPASRA